MSIAIIAPNRDRSSWIRHFKLADPRIQVEIWPDIKDRNEISCVVVWKHPPGELLKYPNLKLICSIGAGVDHILSDPDLPPNVPITKVVDNYLSVEMSNYVISAIINYQRYFPAHFEAKQKAIWLDHDYPPRPTRIGIMGLGTLGQETAVKLSYLGFEVCGYSHSRKDLEGVKSFAGINELEDFLRSVNVIVCMLPLTPQTAGVLNIDLFRKLNKGTYLINVARGEHLIEDDLIRALDEGIISGAQLDVFNQEPLPADHPFWKRKEVMITPHNASVTNPASVARQIMDNYQKIGSDKAFDHEIDRNRGY